VNPYFDKGTPVIELSDLEVFKKRRLFRAERYAEDYPGLAELEAR
jgi:hypothetical protein